MRSQIIHLTLHQEGSTERGRAKLKQGDEKKQATREWRGETKGVRANKSVSVVKLQKEEADWKDGKKGGRRKGRAFEGAAGRDGAKKKMRAVECYCASLIRMAERFYCPKLYSEQPSV